MPKPQNLFLLCPSFLSSRCGVFAEKQCESDNKPTGHGGMKLLAVFVGAALAVGTGAAHAIEAKVSGHINRALMSVNDGDKSELHHVDNNVSSTRFRFTGSAEIMPGITGGVVFENEFESNPSNKVTQTVKSVSPTLGERQSNIYVEGGFGKVSLGQGDGAANGGTEVDLSGTDLVQGALATNALGGAIAFQSGGVAGPTIGATTSNQDFESRYDRLRYDTAALGPVKAAISTGISNSQDVRELALSFSGGMGGGKLAGTIGTSKKDADPAVVGSIDQDTTGGSISWLAAGGLNVTFSTSSKDVTSSRKGKFNYVKIGYRFGQAAVSVDAGTAKDQNMDGDKAKVMGIAWAYKPVKWADVYAGYSKHSLDRTGSNFDDITIVTVGTRFKF